jgi:hypothetical protein
MVEVAHDRHGGLPGAEGSQRGLDTGSDPPEPRVAIEVEESLYQARGIVEAQPVIGRAERLAHAFRPPLHLATATLLAIRAVESALRCLAQDTPERIFESLRRDLDAELARDTMVDVADRLGDLDQRSGRIEADCHVIYGAPPGPGLWAATTKLAGRSRLASGAYCSKRSASRPADSIHWRMVFSSKPIHSSPSSCSIQRCS